MVIAIALFEVNFLLGRVSDETNSLLQMREQKVVQNSSSTVSQKGESPSGCYKKTKETKFSEKQMFLSPFCVITNKLMFFYSVKDLMVSTWIFFFLKFSLKNYRYLDLCKTILTDHKIFSIIFYFLSFSSLNF